MEAIDHVYFASVALALVMLAAAPFFVAALIAWRSSLPAKWHFACLCGLLAYGVAALVDIVWLPWELASNFLAPQLDQNGYSSVSHALFQFSNIGTVVSGLSALIASLLIPLRLRHSWSVIVAAVVSANNSYMDSAPRVRD
jgi:hypothetical protein